MVAHSQLRTQSAGSSCNKAANMHGMLHAGSPNVSYGRNGKKALVPALVEPSRSNASPRNN